MAPGRNWNEASLSENPAIAQLQRLGWTYVPVETLDAERESLKRVVLVPRLEAALRRLNPWMSDDNVHKAVRAITGRQATSLIEANKQQYEDLTYGIALEQDLGDGKKSHPVRFVDYENASANELVVTNQFRVHGTVACSAAANTVCAACTVCAAGTFQGAACTATADTVCTRCDATCTTCTGPRPADCNACLPGSYKAATGCLSCSKCMAGTTQTAA